MPDYTAGKARILLEPSARGFFSKAKAQLRTEAGQQKLQQDVLLRPVATRFRADADAQLRSIRPVDYHVNLRPNIPNRALFRSDAKAQAETHLKGLYANIQVRGTVDMTYANNQLRAWRVKEEARPLKIRVITEHVGGVGRPSGAASGMVRALDRPLQPAETFAFGHNVPILKPKVDDTDIKRGMERAKRDVERPSAQPRIKPTIDQRGFDSELAKLRRAFQPRRLPGPSIRGVELLAPAMLSIASESAPALVAALGGVVAAIEEMSGAALAAPGALAVLGTSIGTLALSVTGIKDAWKALSQQSDRTANQSTSDALAMQRSQEQLRHGLVDVQKAQEDLTKARKDARRELEDLHAEERSSYLSVAEAALDLQKARNELAQPSEGPLDRDEKILRELRAREALSEAIRKQGRARQDTAQADKDGIEGSDRVRAAQEALVRSNEQVAQTLEQIKNGSTGAANAQDKVNAAMAKLSPNAAALTKTLFELRDGPLNDLAKMSSQNMFAGMSDGIKALVNADLPLLNTGFGRVASAINRNFNTAIAGLNTGQNRGVLTRIFGNTEEFHKRLDAAIQPAIRSLGTLAAAGSNAMPKLATQFAHLTDRFAAFIDKADKEGRLDQWINRGIDATESLGRSIGHIISTLHSVGQAFGTGLIPWIERSTKKMDDFFKSGRGQNDLLQVIHLIHQELDDWRPILQDMPTIFAAMAVGIRGAMGGVLPIINAITSTLRFMPGLSGAAVQAFVAWRAFTPILTAMSVALNGVSRSMNFIPGVARTASVSAKSDLRRITTEAEVMSTGVRRSAATAEREAGGSMTRLGGRIRTGATAAMGGLQKAFSGAAAFMTGPWGAAIAIALTFLEQLIEKSHDAADAADSQRQAEEKLAGSLEQVTNAAGKSTRAALGQELEKYQPEQGLQGNVRQAAEAHGINRDRLMQALLPGGQGQATDIYQDIRKELRGPIVEAAGPVAKILAGQGFSEDNLVDAYLGDQDQLGRLREIMDRPQMKLPPQAGGLMGFNLTNITSKLSAQQQGGALVTQYLSSRIPALQSAQTSAQEAQRTATGGTPTLTGNGAAIFGSQAKPTWDGTTGKVEVPGNFETTHKEQADNMKARGDTFEYDAFRDVTTVTLGTDDQNQIINIPHAPSRSTGGPSPTLGAPGPTGGIISELHPGEWVLPRPARRRLGDEWLRAQTRNKAVIIPAGDDSTGAGGDMVRATPHRDEMPNVESTGPGEYFTQHGIQSTGHSYQFGGPVMPFIPLSPGPTGPAPGPGPVPPPAPGPPVGAGAGLPGINPGAPGDGLPLPTPPTPAIAPPGQTGPPPGPGVAQPGPQVGTAHAGGPGAPFDPNGPVNIGRTPDNASAAESADLNAPGPSVDPVTGQITSPQAALPNFGDQLANAFLSPWGMQKDPQSGSIVSTGAMGGTGGAQMDPGTYLGKWAANFGMSLGSELINGVASFFGLSTDNVYFQAFKQTLGFYSGKLGKVGQNVDPTTQSIVGSSIQGYQTLVDPATGTQYLIPNDMAAGGGEPGMDAAPLGDITGLPPGKAPEAGLQPNAIKAERAISAAFPEIQTIGGVRADALKWHPEGLALDVMIPGTGGLNDPTPPKAKELGDRIWAWLGQHASELGVDMDASLWQKPDHHNHIHVAVYGKDNPGPDGTAGGPGIPTAGAPGAAAPGGPPPLMVPGGGRPAAPAPTYGQAPMPGGFSPWNWARSGFAPPTDLPTTPGAGRGGPLASGISSADLFGAGGSSRGFGGARGRVVVLGSSARTRRGAGAGILPGGEPPHDKASVARYIYRAAMAKGYNPHDALAIAAYAQGESSLNPEISGGAQGAGGSAGGDADVVIGLFQEKAGFAKAGGVDPAARYTVAGNVTAYLNQLTAHRGQGDIYDQLLATSVGGPMYTGGRGVMGGLESQVRDLIGGTSGKGGASYHYQYGGLLPQGVTVMHHDQPQPDVVVPNAEAAQAVAALKAIPAPPDPGSVQHEVPRAPTPPDNVNIPKALPPPGRQAAPPPPMPPPPVDQGPPQPAPTAIVPAPPAPGAQPAPTPGPDPTKSYEHPGLKQGVTSGFAAAGNIASMAASAFGGGMGGPLISGAFQQAGKIANDAINVGAAFASGFLHFGGTTENPYGVQERRKDSPPALAQDNRRVHTGNNYFASMDEWRRQNQLQDSQDMQAGMARIK